jgi:hypothetical protein
MGPCVCAWPCLNLHPLPPPPTPPPPHTQTHQCAYSTRCLSCSCLDPRYHPYQQGKSEIRTRTLTTLFITYCSCRKCAFLLLLPLFCSVTAVVTSLNVRVSCTFHQLKASEGHRDTEANRDKESRCKHPP